LKQNELFTFEVNEKEAQRAVQHPTPQHPTTFHVSFIVKVRIFKFCNDINDLHSSPNIVRVIKSRRVRWAGHVARMGEDKGVYRVLLGKPKRRRPLGRPRRRWVDNIRMNLQEVGCGYVDWIGLAQDRDRWWTFVIAVLNLRVP